MDAPNTRMSLGAFLYPTGYHVAAWRDPEVPADAGVNFAHYADLARMSERAKLDFLFLPDSLGIRGRDLPALSRTAIRYVAQFEPLTLLSALAAVTQRIGLTATATTTYHEPYHIARMFASLDHISGGRVGWNVVTSQNPEEANNFGLASHPDHSERYVRAREFVQVVQGLWRTWDEDAFVRDKQSGVFFDPLKVHELNHVGRYFKVRGPLNVPRSPQGQPVIIQAGASDAGRSTAAEIGEIIFTAQTDLSDARAFYSDIKARVARAGRDPAHTRVIVGLFPFVGATMQEARDEHARLQSLIDPVVGLSLLSSELGGVDLSGFPLDGPLPPLPESNAGKSRQALLSKIARDEGHTIRTLYMRVAGSRGHLQVIGTAKTIADELESWLGEAADGFMIMAPTLPLGLQSFLTWVVPELQRRGLFRREYEGRTLRDHLRIPVPRSVAPAVANSPATAMVSDAGS